MSIVEQSTHVSRPAIVPAEPQPTDEILPLQNGDHLSRTEFERRYEAMPNVKKVELIEGIVYIGSPVRFTQHAHPHSILMGWIMYYVSKTPKVMVGDNGSVRLDEDNEPQPDVMLLLPETLGGAARIDEDGYVTGTPAFVCEASASTASIDLHAKKNAYRRNAVREYLVFRTEDQQIDWFELVGGRYQTKSPGGDGFLKSNVFPGLWLDPAALLAGDLPNLFAGIDQGVDTDEHHSYIDAVNKL